MINYGPLAGKLAVIVDILNTTRVWSSKIKLQKNKGEDEAIKQFLINSQIELKHIEIEYTEVDELQKGCTDQCFGDVLFYSELKRLNHPENQSKVSAKKKYIN